VRSKAYKAPSRLVPPRFGSAMEGFEQLAEQILECLDIQRATRHVSNDGQKKVESSALRRSLRPVLRRLRSYLPPHGGSSALLAAVDVVLTAPDGISWDLVARFTAEAAVFYSRQEATDRAVPPRIKPVLDLLGSIRKAEFDSAFTNG
jgi:hypothetical protein